MGNRVFCHSVAIKEAKTPNVLSLHASSLWGFFKHLTLFRQIISGLSKWLSTHNESEFKTKGFNISFTLWCAFIKILHGTKIK